MRRTSPKWCVGSTRRGAELIRWRIRRWQHKKGRRADQVAHQGDMHLSAARHSGPLPSPLSPFLPLPPPHPPQATFFRRAVAIAKAHKATCESKGLKKVADFRASIDANAEASWPAGLAQLKKDITAFAQSFPVVGFDASSMRYKN